MPALIKDAQHAEDQWTLIEASVDSVDQLPEGPIIVPLSLWQSASSELKQREQLGIWLNSDESPELIKDDIEQFVVIALNFPVFADGRAFSYARILREQFGYSGEIRAIGYILIDQMFYMQRVGFNAFLLDDDSEVDTAIQALSTFTENYQTDVNTDAPLLLRI